MGSQEHETSSMADGLSPHEYLQRFWGAHASAFMRWFLALPYAGQVSLLRNASPDMPTDYDVTEPKPKASQLLTPELTLKALLEENGKVFLRLMNARARRSDDCSRHDLVYLTSLRAQDKMPTFSGDTFKNVSLAFIDPADPEQNVQSLLPSASQAILDEKRALIAQGRLIEADVWLTLQMRQQVILTLLTNVAHTFETMFLRQVMMGEVTAAEIGCRLCGSSSRAGAPDQSLLRCTCEAAHYCCKEHQVEDWKNHKTLYFNPKFVAIYFFSVAS
ncbi:hypothetical protein PINS_up008026 [Pythium insidiosum]|nr:hypothetical protein PINS_up008026 [Pythium insidiosum]